MNLLIFHIDLGARHVCRGDHVIGSTERLDGRDQLEVPCVVFDYGFFGGEGDEETLAVQIAKDVGTKMLFAHVVPKKGVMVNHGVTHADEGHRQAWSQEVVSQKRRRTSTRRHSGRGEETENGRNAVGKFACGR